MTGNKGEWSELFVFFKLLADGKLFSADKDLNKTESFIEVNSIYRKDSGKRLEFKITENINLIDQTTGKLILSFPKEKAEEISNRLLKEINSGKKKSDELIQSFNDLLITEVSDKSQKKGDINILIYDPTHGIESDQKFSIKSFLGSKPTLFNANKTTNIIYKINDKTGSAVSDSHLKEINLIASRHKYIDRIKRIIELGYQINFDSYQDDTFKLNLQIIDSDLPEIIAEIVLDKYVNRVINITEVIEKLNHENPMSYDLSQGHQFYEYRIINFLVEVALGMTSKTVWSGEYDVIGGIIIVKQDSEIVCYHLVDFNKFKTYLKNATKLDNPSGGKMGYGEVYMENNSSFIKLNFQIKA